MQPNVVGLVVALFAALVAPAAAPAADAPLSVDLAPSPDNPSSPQMGDQLAFHSIIHNQGAPAVEGLIAWLSLVRIDQGNEQPVDLEDWSAHKAITAASLAPDATIATDWPMRLIQAGTYRVVVSVVSRDGSGLDGEPVRRLHGPTEAGRRIRSDSPGRPRPAAADRRRAAMAAISIVIVVAAVHPRSHRLGA